MNTENKSWSEGLQQQTKDAISELHFSPDGNLHFKNINGGCAYITVQNLMKGNLLLVGSKTDELHQFASVDDLLAAGWAID